MQRTLHQRGQDLSLPRLFESLGGIRETTVIFEPATGERKPRTAQCLSVLSPEQQTLFDALDLRRYQARPPG